MQKQRHSWIVRWKGFSGGGYLFDTREKARRFLRLEKKRGDNPNLTQPLVYDPKTGKSWKP